MFVARIVAIVHVVINDKHISKRGWLTFFYDAKKVFHQY